MEVLDCKTWEMDKNSILASLALFGHADAADMELIVVSMAVVDTEPTQWR